MKKAAVRCEIGEERALWLRSVGLNPAQMLCALIDQQMRGTADVAELPVHSSTALVRQRSDDDDDDDAEEAGRDVVVVQYGASHFTPPPPPPADTGVHGTSVFRAAMGSRLVGRYRLEDIALAQEHAQALMPGSEVRCAFQFIAMEARMPEAWRLVDFGKPGALPKGQDRDPRDPLAPPKLTG